MTLILLIDDVPTMADQYAYDLKRLAGYEAILASSGKEGLDLLDREPVDCVILDLEMPGMDGFAVLRELNERKIVTPVIVYTGTGNFDRCMQAIRLGAYSFIDKAEPMPRVVREIENALEHGRLNDEVNRLRTQVGGDSPLRGDSAAMRDLKQVIGKVAAIPSHVLILGESGSGKELVARDVHRRSQVSAGPFVAINCAALPENLVESELFGHERGAFTGANRMRKGAFETATGGSLFLDEVGELALPVQAKLLRVLEQHEVTRLGGNRVVPVDARVVAATNRDLEEEVKAGRFREDLYYRMNVHILRVPPLRDRRSDIPALVEHFLLDTSERFGMRIKSIGSDAMEILSSYDWHRNNVRELRNVVERMVIAADGEVISAGDVPPDVQGGAPAEVASGGGTFQEQKAESERQIIIAALERNEWHITHTAAELGLADHASLLKIMRRHHVRRPD